MSSGLEEVFRSLGDRRSAEIPAKPEELPGLLAAAEALGAFALKVEGYGTAAPRLRIWKGKTGPCWETGRDAAYRGSALAALDDDAHLLFGRMRLCEKTAALYSLPAYEGRVEVSAGDPALLARLGSDPVPFDCDTFDRDARELLQRIGAPAPAGGTLAVVYPGPFRALVLADGSIVRRGVPVRVPRATGAALLEQDGALPVPDGAPAEHYATRGPAALLGEPAAVPVLLRVPPDLKALDAAPMGLRARLMRVIERGDDYFLLTGSDPADAAGCCPSDDVGAANALRKAGLLDGVVPSPDASCPATLYAFARELKPGSPPRFDRNTELRAKVLERLRSGAGLGPRLAVRMVWMLILLFGVALLLWSLFKD
jgi:hypothetical protein